MKELSFQDDKLQGDLSSVDIATKENLENSEEDLLKSPVSHINMDTGGYEPVKDGGTYEEALQRFAKLLSEERNTSGKSNSAPAKEEENLKLLLSQPPSDQKISSVELNHRLVFLQVFRPTKKLQPESSTLYVA
ncbi:hypothetical protein NC652_018812 [Populus alba x Populus x berolinensis]|nr:hypothetical protein NC652_018812 [Populus alba x Populus x berolinensis]